MIGTDTILLWTSPVVLITAVLMVRRRASFTRTLAALAMTGYALVVVSATLFPLPIDAGAIASRKAIVGFSYNLIPLETVRDSLTGPRGSGTVNLLIGNLLLLAPLTFLGAVLWPRLRSWRRALLLGFSVSLSIELLQLTISAVLGFSYKIFDIDDLVLNTVGALIGYAVFVVLQALTVRLRRQQANRGPGSGSL